MEPRLEGILSRYRGEQVELIPILQQVQKEFTYLPEAAMRRIARFVRVAESRVYAVASFYAQFRFTPTGRHRVTVCTGTACHVQGAPRILDELETALRVKAGQTTADGEYTLETAACIGCCALAPCMMVNETVEAKLTPQRVRKLFEKERTHED